MNRAFLCVSALSIVLSASDTLLAGIPNLAITIPYTGVGLHYNLTPSWALEARYLIDRYESDAFGDISSDVIGLRAQHYALRQAKIWPYLGAEAAYVSSDSATYDTSGVALGAFVGAELFTLQRASFGLDAGPYIISSETKNSTTSSSDLEFIINAFINLYVF